MIHDEIHDQFDIPFMEFFDKLFKILHRTEFGHNALIITDIVTHIRIGRVIYRTKPDCSNSKPFQVVQSGNDALNVANAVGI